MTDEEEEDIDEILEDEDEETPPEKPTVAGPSCTKCGKSGNDVPLIFVNGAFYCVPHTPEGVVSKTAEEPAKPAKPAKPPWLLFELLPMDAIRKKVRGTNTILQSTGGGKSDEIHMNAGDKVVIKLVRKDGKEYTVFEETTAQGIQLGLMSFTYSTWGPSTLMPHMRSGNLTPPGYH